LILHRADRQTFLKALRGEVRYQTYAQRRGVKACQACYRRTRELETDHVIPFHVIVARFMGPGDWSEEWRVASYVITREGPRFHPALDEFAQAWREFHASMARYRVLCKPCHLAKTKHEQGVEYVLTEPQHIR
jgi:5-methylcytosine-specific restriction endonuclease McrA